MTCLKSLLVLAILIGTFQSQAQDKPPQPINNPDQNGAPPQPVNPGNGIFRYSDLIPVYDAGVKSTQTTLSGKWNVIAVATSLPCASLAIDAYDPKGIKNSDGSIVEFVFETIIKPVPPGSNQPAPQIFTVKMNNLGQASAFQGPYALDPNEPQFAQWTYNGSGAQVNDAYLSYYCRISSADVNILVCAENIVILDRTVYSPNPAVLACADDKDFSSIYLLSRK